MNPKNTISYYFAKFLNEREEKKKQASFERDFLKTVESSFPGADVKFLEAGEIILTTKKAKLSISIIKKDIVLKEKFTKQDFLSHFGKIVTVNDQKIHLSKSTMEKLILLLFSEIAARDFAAKQKLKTTILESLSLEK